MKPNTHSTSKAYIKVRIDRKLILIFFIPIIIVSIIVIGSNFLKNKYTYVPYVIEEPNAPLTSSLSTIDFEQQPTSYSIPVNQDNQEKISNLGNISKIEYSQDRTKAIFLTDNFETTSLINILSPKIYAESIKGKTLSLTDSTGIVIKTIENENILDASFFENDYIYYQVIDSGIYIYKISTDTKTKLIETLDLSAFKNFALIDSNKYFFIQPTTGKMGLGQIDNNQIAVIDTKALEVSSNYAMASAYQLASVSPDKKYIAIIDKTAIDLKSFKVNLIILPTNATKITDAIYSTQISLTPGVTNKFDWSLDSTLLIGGDNATIVDVINKQIVYSSSLFTNNAVLSPDKSKIFLCSNATPTEENKCYIQIINGQQIPVTKLVSQARWLNNSKVIMVIGTKLYSYDLNSSLLELVSNDSGEYEILDVFNSKAVVRFDNEIKIIQLKS